jgi:hypothetical protein
VRLNRNIQSIKTINTTYIVIMKFNFFRKKSNVECIKCGKKFKNEIELTDHNRTAHTA